MPRGQDGCRAKRASPASERARGRDVRERGFSLIEMVVAVALTMVAVGSVFSLLDPAQGAFATGLEAADVQQRLRVAQNSLFDDFAMAGAGPQIGGRTRALIY